MYVLRWFSVTRLARAIGTPCLRSKGYKFTSSDKPPLNNWACGLVMYVVGPKSSNMIGGAGARCHLGDFPLLDRDLNCWEACAWTCHAG